MISWDMLNSIIEERMIVPMAIKLTPTSEKENEEIELYNQIIQDVLRIKPDWKKENLFDACRRAGNYLSAKYTNLSSESIEKLVNYFAYCWK